MADATRKSFMFDFAEKRPSDRVYFLDTPTHTIYIQRNQRGAVHYTRRAQARSWKMTWEVWEFIESPDGQYQARKCTPCTTKQDAVAHAQKILAGADAFWCKLRKAIGANYG